MRFAESSIPRLQLSYLDCQGASPREQMVEACRRDNIDLYGEVLDSMKDKGRKETAEFLNSCKDVTGNYLLHVCATYGSCAQPCLITVEMNLY